jgi:hypothetical protein
VDKATREQVSRLYWRHIGEQIQVLPVLVVHRAAEIAGTAITDMNGRGVLCPAILARSMLEIAATFAVEGSRIINITQEAIKLAPQGRVVSTDLESMLTRLVFGRRSDDPPKHLMQTNALTHLKTLTGLGHEEVMPAYEYLCEVAHPNWCGYERFCDETRQTPTGIVDITVNAKAEPPSNAGIREKTLWAISWSAMTLTGVSTEIMGVSEALYASRLCR